MKVPFSFHCVSLVRAQWAIYGIRRHMTNLDARLAQALSHPAVADCDLHLCTTLFCVRLQLQATGSAARGPHSEQPILPLP
jgi:hypothetical protein